LRRDYLHRVAKKMIEIKSSTMPRSQCAGTNLVVFDAGQLLCTRAGRTLEQLNEPGELEMYKTILVHIDGTVHAAQRIAAAAQLAIAHDAHLVGAAPTGLSAFMFPATSIEAGAMPIVFPVEELRAEADLALDAFDSQAQAAGVGSFERRRIDEDAGLAIALAARYADLVVISQTVEGDFQPRLRSDFPEFVILGAARPVLVLPAAGATGPIGRSITVAWNGSDEALRAITSAIPLLKRADKVDLLVIRNEGLDDPHGEEPGADMSLYLARHGIRVALCSQPATSHAGEALLSFAADKGADLIVMGAYGHSRFREFLLGGATDTALHASPLPLWMSH
jgi:nucleotide-binding universal stress UspA family protein